MASTDRNLGLRNGISSGDIHGGEQVEQQLTPSKSGGSSNLTTSNERHIVSEQPADELRRVEKRDSRRRTILAGLQAGLGLAAILSMLNSGKLVQSVKATEYSSPQFDDFLDQSSNPSAPSSGLTRIFTKSGLLYKETPDGVVSPFGSAVKSEDYIIFIDPLDSKIKALNGTTGAIDYSGTEPALVINNAINGLTNGGKVFIRAGTYVLASLNVTMGGEAGNAAIGSSSVSGIELCGEGAATHLQLGTNQNGTVIGILNVNNWYIHDLQVDGNRANQSGTGTNPELMGMNLYNTTNTVVQNCYIHDAKTYGIQMYGTNCRILGNYVLNSNGNGVILYGGSGYVVKANIINGASDVGLDASGASSPISDVVLADNVVLNVNMNVSPWSLNTGIGIMVGDNGYVERVSIKGNIIDSCSSSNSSYGFGFVFDPGSGTNLDVTFEGNEIYDCTFAANIESSSNISLINNLIDTITSTSGGYYAAIEIGSACSNCIVKGNTFLNISPWCTIDCNAPGTMIEGNMMPGGGKYGIKLGATATKCLVLGNILAATWTSAAFTDNGTGTLTLNNLGINPLGEISTPINTTNNTIGTNGTTSTPVASTSYTVQGAPITVNSTGGTGVSITITDGAGNAVLSGLATLSGQRLPYGWKINFGAFTAAPTVAVFAE